MHLQRLHLRQVDKHGKIKQGFIQGYIDMLRFFKESLITDPFYRLGSQLPPISDRSTLTCFSEGGGHSESGRQPTFFALLTWVVLHSNPMESSLAVGTLPPQRGGHLAVSVFMLSLLLGSGEEPGPIFSQERDGLLNPQ